MHRGQSAEILPCSLQTWQPARWLRRGLWAFGAVLWALAVPLGAQAAPVLIAKEIPTRGPVQAPVVVVVASEFQCPYCSRVAATLAKLEQANPGKIRLAFVHYPLEFHAHAQPAAVAAQAAHRQGLFWAMHDALFARQRQMGDGGLDQAVADAGVDAVRLGRDLADPALQAHVAADTAAMLALGVRGTPASFVNGVSISGAQPIEKFQEVVDAALRDPPRPGETTAAHWERRQPGIGGKLAGWLQNRAALPPSAAQDTQEEEEPAAAQDPTVWRVPVDPKVDAVLGDGPAVLLTLVLWTDLQCPFCARAAKTASELRDRYPGLVRLVFKHHPLPFHKLAVPAHLAAMAAGRQGQFWAFHDQVFADQRAMDEAGLQRIAVALKLDLVRWGKDREDPALRQQVQEDVRVGGRVGIDGTPTMYLNGRRILGAVPLQDLVDVAEQELKRARANGWSGQVGYLKAVAEGKTTSPLADQVQALGLPELPSQGAAKGAKELVIFFDYQCPFCVKLGQAVQRWLPSWQKAGPVRVVWAPFPLSHHASAKAAAVLAQEAMVQGKFEAVHAGLLGLAGALDDAALIAVAKAAAMDLAALEKARSSGRHDAVVAASVKAGLAAGVDGTPSAYLGGRRVTPGTAGWEILNYLLVPSKL